MKKIALLLLITICSAFVFLETEKPVVYIIGDSTVKNGDGTGKNNLWGWGSLLGIYFDTTKIEVQNLAIGGRSSRTFITEGRWDKVLSTLKKGDYVLMQFGHNDAGPLDDTARARGTIDGIDSSTKEIYNPITKKQELVYTYGYYMRKYIKEAQAKGAIPIVCSLIPRNDWKQGKVIRHNDSYALWASEVAKQEHALFIPLNELVSSAYELIGMKEVTTYFPLDHTHTNYTGAALNAKIIQEQFREFNLGGIKKYLIPVPSQQWPTQKKILKSMQLANKYFMDKWPDAGKSIITNKERQSNIWTRAVYYEGLMSLYNIKPQQKYYDYAVQWGEKHQWGLVGGANTRHADNHCAGQTYLDLYQIDKQEQRIIAIKTAIDLMVQSDKKDDWSWVDALQMAMPVFARLGVMYHDTLYFKKMYDLYDFTKHQHGGSGLYNNVDHLWYRDKDFVPPYKEPNGKNCYWSRGNGWVFAALARALNYLPTTDAHYQEYLADFKAMAEAILPLQRFDGFWNVSLLDPIHFEGKESSGTALFAYGFAWGINHGILAKNIYKPAIVKAWNGLTNFAMHKNGALGYVQSTGKEPKDVQPINYNHFPDFEDYGLGCYLMAGAEIYKLN